MIHLGRVIYKKVDVYLYLCPFILNTHIEGYEVFFKTLHMDDACELCKSNPFKFNLGSTYFYNFYETIDELGVTLNQLKKYPKIFKLYLKTPQKVKAALVAEQL